MEGLTEQVKKDMIIDKLTLVLYTKEIRDQALTANLEPNWFLHCFKLFERELIDLASQAAVDTSKLSSESLVEAFGAEINRLITERGITGFFEIITPLDFGRTCAGYDVIKEQIKANLLKALQ